MTLYDITGEYLQLLEYADDAEDEQLFLDTLESITGELEVKADGYGVVINELNTRAEQFDKEIQRLTARKKAMENAVKRMKERLKGAMELMDVKEVKTEHYTFKIQNNGGKAPINYTAEVPMSYKRVVYENDTDRIRLDLESGKKLDFAELLERGTHLRIK